MKRSLIGPALPALIACLCAASCTNYNQPEKAKPVPPEVTAVNFQSPDIRPGDTVRALSSATDRQGIELRYEYKWFHNDTLMDGVTSEVIDSYSMAPGDKLYVKVRAIEVGTNLSSEWKMSKPVRISEPRPLQIKGVDLEPKVIHAADTVEAVIDYGDLDPNDVDAVYYRWNVNGSDLLGPENSAPTLDPGRLTRGDQVKVTVCLDDLFKAPNVWTSPTYTVADTSPEFTYDPQLGYEGSNIVVYFQVEDADKDPLTYSLTGAPQGSYIDARAGKAIISTQAQPGTYVIVITASDGHGGSAGKPITITIPQQQQ